MQFYESASTDPYDNLAMEDFFFSCMDRTQEYFLLWQNDRAVIVGKYQNTLEEVNQRFVDDQGIRVARRLSGGGAVYHDLGNLNYTFIVDEDRADSFCFETFTRPVIAALEKLGVSAQASGRNDITIHGQKISGSAQYLRGGRLLHHGCIMLDCDADTLDNVLQVKEDKIKSKSIKSVRSRVTSVNEHLERPISMDQFKQALREQVFASGKFNTAKLSQEDLGEIQRLRDSRYATWEWNYGKSPRCDVRKERRYPFGGITLYLSMDQGVLQDIRIYGDFFSRQDLSPLEEMLCGRRLVPGDFAPLSDVELDSYISGLTWEALIDLLCY